MKILAAAILLIVAAPAAAVPAQRTSAKFIAWIDQMMVALGPQNVQASRAIRRAYAPQLDLLVLEEYADLAGALDARLLAPLPADPQRFNLAPRLDGPHPIGEKDLSRQHSYIAARPATIGLLLEVASRVKSGPLEITSLVRHGDYQESLRGTNPNASTAVPMHTMGLAFDIALVNTAPKTISEIRDVLVRMRDAGDLMFMGERRQLVFHVVPHPARMGHFTDVYNRAAGVPSAVRGAHVIAASPKPKPSVTRTGRTPRVTAEVVAILPTDEFATEWWIGEPAAHTATAERPASPAPVAPVVPEPAPVPETRSARLLMVLAGLVTTIVALTRQQRDRLGRQRGAQIFDAADTRRVPVEA